jgi:hypothetical protein
MMEGKMHGKGLEKAKMHYDMLMEALSALGMSLAEFEDQMESGEEMEEGEEYGEEGEKAPKPMDKGKIAIVVARMKNKMKGE